MWKLNVYLFVQLRTLPRMYTSRNGWYWESRTNDCQMRRTNKQWNVHQNGKKNEKDNCFNLFENSFQRQQNCRLLLFKIQNMKKIKNNNPKRGQKKHTTNASRLLYTERLQWNFHRKKVIAHDHFTNAEWKISNLMCSRMFAFVVNNHLFGIETNILYTQRFVPLFLENGSTMLTLVATIDFKSTWEKFHRKNNPIFLIHWPQKLFVFERFLFNFAARQYQILRTKHYWEY